MEEQIKTSEKSLQIQNHSSTDIIPNPSDGLAWKSKDLIKQVIPTMNLPSEGDKTLFINALKRFEITERELNDSFWEAYADPYVPSSGVEFRHLWKHIEKMRNGSGDKLYTRLEMLNICHKENITTDHFEFIEKDQWRRK